MRLTVAQGLDIILGDNIREAGAEEGLRCLNGTDSFGQFFESAVFQQVSRGAGFEDIDHKAPVVINGQGDDFDLGGCGQDLADRLHAVQIRQTQIQQDDIRGQVLHLTHHRRPFGGFSHHLQPGFFLQ